MPGLLKWWLTLCVGFFFLWDNTWHLTAAAPSPGGWSLWLSPIVILWPPEWWTERASELLLGGWRWASFLVTKLLWPWAGQHVCACVVYPLCCGCWVFPSHPYLASWCSRLMENSRGPLKQGRFSSARKLPSQGNVVISQSLKSTHMPGLPFSPHLQLSKKTGRDSTVHSCWKYQSKIKASGDRSSKGRFEKACALPSRCFYLWLTTWKCQIPSKRILPSFHALFVCFYVKRLRLEG